MRKWLGRIAFATIAAWAIAGLGTAAAQGAKSTRPTVAVLDFDFGSVQHWWSGNWDIGKGIADLMVDGLVEDGSYRIIERKKLGAIINEQNFSNSDRADPSAAKVAQIGKALGVKYMIVGSITKFGMENKNLGINAGAFGGGKFGLGEVGTKKGKATVAITARIVDTSTGEVMAVGKAEGTSSRSGLLLGAGGGGGGGGAAGSINMGSSDFQDTVLGEATELAVKNVVAKLVAAKNRLE
jgi:curli biogenesis system outer membrane secretion channel CsgG